jgi:hypothetical protein
MNPNLVFMQVSTYFIDPPTLEHLSALELNRQRMANDKNYPLFLYRINPRLAII